MQQHLEQPKGFGQSTGQLPCSSAIGDQHPSTDVVSTHQGDLPDRSRHRLDGEIQSTFSKLLGVLTQLLHQRLKPLSGRLQIRWLIAIRAEHRRESLHLQSTEKQVGIGNGQWPATSITGGAWFSTSRAWPHRQAATITADDRPPTCRHGMDRQPERCELKSGDLGDGIAFPLPVGSTRRQAEHIRAGAPHIHAHQGRSPQASLLCSGNSSDHAARRTRQNGVFGEQ
ncbi:MAG: Uncharacterised protein [Cyanobium sp. ARS6]|nr:MAG: Uncharacterised protein [Cyanobium sp. ARS6]